MKKLILSTLFIASALSFQACNNAAKTDTQSDSTSAAADSSQNMGGDVKEDDSDFMTTAANGGMMEVEAGKLAQANGASAAVKEFGARMVADHSKANEELKALAASKNVVLPTSPSEEVQGHLNEMSTLKGAAFDKHYMDMMVNDHDKTVSLFEGASRDAKDADVRAWAAKTLPVLKEHQTAAKAINDKMK